MTSQQRKFADEYLILNSGTKAAIAAGYSQKTARVQASQLLVNEEIEAYIIEKRQESAKKHNVTLDRVIEEYSKIAFFDIRKVYGVDGALLPISQMDDEEAGAIASVKTLEVVKGDMVIGESKEIKVFDKIRALQDLGKHLGIFERDNQQKKPENQNAPVVNVYNTAPPLAGSEEDV